MAFILMLMALVVGCESSMDKANRQAREKQARQADELREYERQRKEKRAKEASERRLTPSIYPDMVPVFRGEQAVEDFLKRKGALQGKLSLKKAYKEYSLYVWPNGSRIEAEGGGDIVKVKRRDHGVSDYEYGYVPASWVVAAPYPNEKDIERIAEDERIKTMEWLEKHASEKKGRSCCKFCENGKACGDTCIPRNRTCTDGRGCACNAW
jgi:hypothetical protein